MNYFELFEITPSFIIDKEDLRKKYYLKHRESHPDMHGLKSADEQMQVLEASTEINRAYKVLMDDDERIRYLLEISGIEFAEGKENVPQEFLLEVMDINEMILDYQMNPETELKKDIFNQLSLLKNNLLNNIDGLLKNFEYQNADIQQLESIKQYYLKNKYLKRIELNLEN